MGELTNSEPTTKNRSSEILADEIYTFWGKVRKIFPGCQRKENLKIGECIIAFGEWTPLIVHATVLKENLENGKNCSKDFALHSS